MVNSNTLNSLSIALWSGIVPTTVLLPLIILGVRRWLWSRPIQHNRTSAFPTMVSHLMAAALLLPSMVWGVAGADFFDAQGWFSRQWFDWFKTSWSYTLGALITINCVIGLVILTAGVIRAYQSLPASCLRWLYFQTNPHQVSMLWHIERPLLWRAWLQAWLFAQWWLVNDLGIALIVGGDIPGRTQTLAAAVVSSSAVGAHTATWSNLSVLSLLNFMLIAGMLWLERQQTAMLTSSVNADSATARH